MERKPIIITNVSTSYFSVARYTGGATIQGEPYTYCPIRDILIKRDWMKIYQKMQWEDFLSAVKSGKKPSLLKLARKKQDNDNNKFTTPSLFD